MSAPSPIEARRFLIQMHGEPGSGKSTLALAIARDLPAIVLDKDIISSGLLRAGLAKGTAGPGSYEALWGLSRSILEQGHSVIVDSPAFWPLIEQKGRGIARALGAHYAMLETRCASRDELARRLQTRERLESQPHEIADWEAQPGAAAPTCERLILDTSRPAGDLAAEAIAYLRALAASPALLLRRREGPSPHAATRFPGRTYSDSDREGGRERGREGERAGGREGGRANSLRPDRQPGQYVERPSDTPAGPAIHDSRFAIHDSAGKLWPYSCAGSPSPARTFTHPAIGSAHDTR